MLVTALLLVAGVINTIPVIGVISPARLEALYGVPMDDPNLAILMRHRALLFGVLGGFLIAAAFLPALQVGALIAGLVSMVGFLAIALLTGGYSALLRKVVIADIVGIVAALGAAAALAVGT